MVSNTIQAQSIFTGTSMANAPKLNKEMPSDDRFISFLTDLKRDDAAFNHGIRTRTVRAGAIVATPENLTDELFILMEGVVNFVCTNPKGKLIVASTLEAGAIFGEGAVGSDRDTNLFVEAVNDVTVWIIPAVEARSKAIHYPILSWGLLKTYGERLFQVENNLEDVAYKTLPERLAALLLDLCNEEDGLISGLSHQKLADHLGTYRETVSAILREFKSQGLVQLGYRRIHILERELLEEVAGIWKW